MNVETMKEITEKVPGDYEIVFIHAGVTYPIQNSFEIDVENHKLILK